VTRGGRRFESVFLGAVRLARALAAELDGRTAPGSLSRDGGSVVFVLASPVRVLLAELGISNGLFPGLAGVVKTLAGELGPAGIRMNAILPVRIASGRVCELDALSVTPMRCVRAHLSERIPLRRPASRHGRAAGPMAARVILRP